MMGRSRFSAIATFIASKESHDPTLMPCTVTCLPREEGILFVKMLGNRLLRDYRHDIDEEFINSTGFSLRVEPTKFVEVWRFYACARDVSSRDESYAA
jgi:hypothetical protein